MTDPATVLERSTTIAIVGFSRDPRKTAHRVPAEMIDAGFEVIPVNPHTDSILGRPTYPTLREVPVPIDLVNVFRPSADAPAVAREAAEVGAKALWLQLDIMSEEARRIAAEAGMIYIEDTCIAVVRAQHGISKR